MLGGMISGDDVRGQLILNRMHAVLQSELFLFQPLDRKLVGDAREFELRDLFIERTMTLLQRHQFIAQFLLLLAVHLFFVQLSSNARATIGLFAVFCKSGLKVMWAEHMLRRRVARAARDRGTWHFSGFFNVMQKCEPAANGHSENDLSRFTCHETANGGAMMSLEGHLAELTEKHRLLDEQIGEEAARPGSDDVILRRMKQEKLKLKEEIERLKHETRH